MIGAGEGIFSTYDKENCRLFFHGPARLAAALGGDGLSDKPVLLPSSALYSGIGHFNSHICATIRSGRKSNSPISRKDQRGLAGAA